MNLERLLAENMLRFGTRNLTEHQVKRILKEQISSVPSEKFTNQIIEDFVNSPTKWPEPFATAARTTLAFLRNNKISFTNVSLEKAAAVITLVENNANKMYSSGKMAKKVKTLDDIVKILTEPPLPDSAFTMEGVAIQLNESPDQPGMVLTNGFVRPTGVAAADPGAASSIDDIVTFCNNYNIANKIQFLNGAQQDDSIDIQYPQSFIPGDPKKDPGAGSLDLFQAVGLNNIYYSKDKYTAASGKSTGLTNITIEPIPGPSIPVVLDKDSFPILQITLSQKGIDAIKEAVEAAKKLGQIQNVKIESAASFDERVLKNNAEFAKAVGLQPNQVPADPTKDAEGVVKDPMYGGNSFLAYMRGQAIVKQLAALGVQSTAPVAIVKTGKDASRYAKLEFEVKKPDGETTFTADELKSIGQGSKSDSGAGRFQIFKFGK